MTTDMDTERRTVQFSPNTRNLFFHILTQCNLSCRHCYINPEQHGKRVLDRSTMEEWLELFCHPNLKGLGVAGSYSAGPDETNVIFLGGEPTLNPALPDAIRRARELGYKSVTVDTNGYLHHNILEKVEPSEVDYFSFSLDGSTPEVNDPIRGEGVFKTCVAGLEKALSRGFGVSVIFTVSRMNIHDLVNMPPLLESMGVRRFFIQVIGIRGKSAQGPGSSLQLHRSEWEEVVPRVANQAAHRGIHVTYPRVFLDSSEEFACAGIVADNYFVFPNGRIYRCPLCEDYPIHSLEIRDGAIVPMPPIRECDLFGLKIPEGCVLNKILHPGNIIYDQHGNPLDRIACCMLKNEVLPASPLTSSISPKKC